MFASLFHSQNLKLDRTMPSRTKIVLSFWFGCVLTTEKERERKWARKWANTVFWFHLQLHLINHTLADTHTHTHRKSMKSWLSCRWQLWLEKTWEGKCVQLFLGLILKCHFKHGNILTDNFCCCCFCFVSCFLRFIVTKMQCYQQIIKFLLKTWW